MKLKKLQKKNGNPRKTVGIKEKFCLFSLAADLLPITGLFKGLLHKKHLIMGKNKPNKVIDPKHSDAIHYRNIYQIPNVQMRTGWAHNQKVKK